MRWTRDERFDGVCPWRNIRLKWCNLSTSQSINATDAAFFYKDKILSYHEKKTMWPITLGANLCFKEGTPLKRSYGRSGNRWPKIQLVLRTGQCRFRILANARCWIENEVTKEAKKSWLVLGTAKLTLFSTSNAFLSKVRIWETVPFRELSLYPFSRNETLGSLLER